MNKTVFTNNPLNRTSNLRSDVDWIKSIKQDQKTNYIIFCNEKPLIDPSSDHSKNSEIKLFNFAQLHNLIDEAQYLVFLGQNEGESFFAVDLSNRQELIKVLHPVLSQVTVIKLSLAKDNAILYWCSLRSPSPERI